MESFDCVLNPPSKMDSLDKYYQFDFALMDTMLDQFQNAPELKQAFDVDLEKKDNAEALGSLLISIDNNLQKFERESVEDYVKSCHELLLLHKHIETCDGILLNMENMLTNFQKGLSVISTKIQKLQKDSVQMSVKVSNRKISHEILSTYIQQIVVTPHLATAIANDPINVDYLQHLDALVKKLEHASQPGMHDHPSSVASIPVLEQLKQNAVGRIRGYFVERIQTLKKEKTNIQIIQQDIIEKDQSIYAFLTHHSSTVASEIRQFYVQSLSNVYFQQFRTYMQSMSKCELETSSSLNELIGTKDSRGMATSGGARAVGRVLGFNLAQSKSRSNFFSLAGRDAVLKDLNRDPLVINTQEQRQAKYTHEQIFFSNQKLLVDTCTTEFIFISEFFGCSNIEQIHSIFIDVFGKTLAYYVELFENFLLSCQDTIGFLLLAKINECNRRTMGRRGIPCLDAYFDRIHALVAPQLKSVLLLNINSLHPNNAKSLMEIPGSQCIQPHYVSRRFAELSSALLTIDAISNIGASCNVSHYINMMQSQAIETLTAMSACISNRRNQIAFLINNYDFIISVYLEHHLSSDTTSGFEALLSEQIAHYVEDELYSHFRELVTFVKTAEETLKNVNSESATEIASVLDISIMEKLVVHFSETWTNILNEIQRDVITTFTNFTNGMEILKQLLTQILLYYTRFQQIVNKTYATSSGQQPVWIKQLVPINVILTEIRRYSRAFDS